MLWFLRGRSATPSQFKRNNLRKPSSGVNSGARAQGPREILMFRDREVHVLRKPYKRSIGLTLQVNGRIRVSAPKSTPLARIEAFLLANAEWIETHLQKYQTLRDSYPPKSLVEGERFLFQGRELVLVFKEGHRARVKFAAQGNALIAEIPPQAWVRGFNPNQPHPELMEDLIAFYKREAKEILERRLAFYSEKMDLVPAAVSFRSQKTRWGSCTSKGKISLNWRLIVAPLEVIDYVVVHELSHLRFYNHGSSFWALVGTQLSNYLELRQWLKDHQYEADFLAKSSELHI